MALGRSSEAFVPKVETQKVMPKTAEKVKAITSSPDEVQGKTREAMGGLLAEVLDGQEAKKIAENLEKGGEKALTVEQRNSIHRVRGADKTANIDYGTTKNVIKVAEAEMAKQFGPSVMAQVNSIEKQFG